MKWNRKDRRVWLSAAAALAGVCVIGAGCRHHHHHGGRFGDRSAREWDRLLASVEADDAQRRQVSRLADAMRAEQASAEARGAALVAELEAEWSSEQPDPERLRQRVREEMEWMEEAALRMLDATLELHAALTPDQRERLASHQRRGHRGDRR